MKKAVAYLRVSTTEQADSGLSLINQRVKIEAFCVAHDLELVAILDDAGASAKNLNRPQLETALSMVRRGEVQALIVLKLDRLTRSVRDLGALVELFEKTGVALMAVQDSIDTSTAAGRLVLNVLGAVSQWEREAIGERTRDAMKELRRQGKRASRWLPYGHDLNQDGKTLQANPTEQSGITVARELRGRGLSLRKIADELHRQGFKPKLSSRWQAQTVKRLLVGL